LRISPNNKIPAIVDPNTGDLSVFESGAILTYLAQHYRLRSSEQLLPSAESDPRGNATVLQWLNWQMGGFGPMLGQYNRKHAHTPTPPFLCDYTHASADFYNYAPEKIEYAIARYRNEAKRLFDVLDKQLAANEYVAGAHYSIADIAIWPWAIMIPRFGEEFASAYPHVTAWVERLKRRSAVNKVWIKVSETVSKPPAPFTDEQKKILFGIEAKK